MKLKKCLKEWYKFMIITTSYNPDKKVLERVDLIAKEINGTYVKRNKQSIQNLMKNFNINELIVVENEHSKYFSTKMEQPFFLHPNMATLRINRLKQGDNDVMVQIADLKAGDSFLDCTIGLGSDSIVASYIAGPVGKVVGFESQSILAVLVKDGMSRGWRTGADVNSAMKRIEVINDHHLDGLKALPDKSFDIVYFDPMFRYAINKSSPINPLRYLANPDPITYEAINEAKRVARRKVILKENCKSNEFERFGFERISRSSSITYGVITVNGDDYR